MTSLTVGDLTVVLASSSPSRRSLLQAAGVDVAVQPSSVDEGAELHARFGSAEPSQIREGAMFLARAKAMDVIESMPSASRSQLVIGADSVLDVAGQWTGKPGTAEAARTKLKQLSGTTATLCTGHYLQLNHGGVVRSQSFYVCTDITFAELNDPEIDCYVSSGEPAHVAGGVTIEGLGSPFIRSIEGDYTNVVGLSIPAVRQVLLDWGIHWVLSTCR